MLFPRPLCPLVLLAAAPLVVAPIAAAQVVYVDADAAGANDGSSWADAYTDLQAALAATSAGEIWVAEGVYRPGPAGATDSSFWLSSGVALYGGFSGNETSLAQRDVALHPTILDGDLEGDDVVGSGPFWYLGWDIGTPNATHVVRCGAVDATAVLDGFTIRNGYAAAAGSTAGWGGGIFSEGGSPTIRNCTVTHCMAAFGNGGAMAFIDGAPRIEHCTVLENYCHLGRGAGIFLTGTCAATVRDTTFTYGYVKSTNGAEGGGLSSWSTSPVLVERCAFFQNTVRAFYVMGDQLARGGGISTFDDGMTVDSCTFIGNYAHAGGGLYTWGNTTIVNSLFHENQVESYATSTYTSDGGYGAAICSTSAQTGDTTEIVNCTITSNHATDGGAVTTGWNHAGLLENTIVWGNTTTSPDIPPVKANVEGTNTIRYSCVEALLAPIPGEDPPDPADFPGSIDADPLFVDLAGGDLHLSAGSPCVDAGENAAVPAGLSTDLEGQPRFQDDPAAPDVGAGTAPLVDMGALERAGSGDGCAIAVYCVAAQNSQGAGAHLSTSGTASVAANDLVLHASGAVPGQFGLFYYGPNAVQVPFGDGFRCVGGGAYRLNPPLAADPSGALSRALDLGQPPASSGPGAITAGSRWYFQLWYRDPAAGGAGYNLSDGLDVTFCP